MKCSKCGKEVNKTDNYCPYCKNQLKNILTRDITDPKNANYLNIIAILLIGIAIISKYSDYYFINNYAIFYILLSFLIVIYVNVRYPKNILGKVLLVLYVIAIILLIISIIKFLIMCGDFIIKIPETIDQCGSFP